MSEPEVNANEFEELGKAIDSDAKRVNIRLREGEYQFSLCKAIAAFGLELQFPDAKDLVRKMYGENRLRDQPFLNKIQTILKKMEKSGVLRILPKEKPWDLQRYALTSFRFQDVDRNVVSLVSKEEAEKLRKTLNRQPRSSFLKHQSSPKFHQVRLPLLASIMTLSLIVCLWSLTLVPINLIILLSSFGVATASSVALGVQIANRKRL